MTSKYAAAAKEYDEKTKFTGVSDKALNFIGLTKKKPKTYVQLLSDELLPVPTHNYIEVPGNGGGTRHMSFVCRSLIKEPCYICDKGLDPNDRPRKRMIGQAIEFEKDGREYRPVREDIVVTPETGAAIAEKYPDLRPEIEPDRYTFRDMPRVGILDGNRSIDDGMAIILTEEGSINDCVFLIARKGEGLQTTYSAMRMADSPIDFDADDDELTQEVRAAIEMSMSVDDYIDAYISEERVRRAFGLDSDDGRGGRDDDGDEAPRGRSRRRPADDEDDDDSDDDVDIDQMFAKSFRRGRRDA